MKRVKKENDDVSSPYLPQDLIAEILVKLPTKSIPKLIVVSKLWSSIIRSKHFIDLYLKRSLTRPCFLFSFERDSTWFFLSASQEAKPSSCTTTTTSFSLRLDQRLLLEGYYISPPVRGLICCQDLNKVVIMNPSTGQFLFLPKVRTRRRHISSFFGYDPIRDEYKVLCMTVLQVSCKHEPVVSEEHQVFTLGGGAQKKEATWRMIECKVPHCPATNGVCMANGVIYYGAWSNSDIRSKRGSLVVGFDVRLEEFTLFKLPDCVEISSGECDMVNYQGKVALVNHNHSYNGKFDMWVLEDVDKQDWSKISVVVPSRIDVFGPSLLFYCRGAISSSKFIFSPFHPTLCPFFIVSYDRKEDIATRVEIKGLEDNSRYVVVFLDHVECPVFL
ncbi:hypothetical protein CARUB_v10002560mg [Capsella rubella]|uniref:F-box domain-containing protein n=1 Tax=Capsella rubella TaxID=81985 RepID=R0HAN1_9BRAS|nr:F-box/kelch-repeat protein At3g04660 [Capsella rubella]EOA22035.1 hypothetical protein CARUB_v10002560mg [Capsella rubella]